jgi:UPF0176 protein
MEGKLFIVTTFYKFVALTDLPELKLQLIKFCRENEIKGTILIAEEGINSTVTGTRESIDKFYTFIKSIDQFDDLEFKESLNAYMPFKRLKIKIRKEIVTFKVGVDAAKNSGVALNADEWDKLLATPEAIVIDTRNDYEVAFGTFKGAINPKTRVFTELPNWVENNLTDNDKEKPVLMFCTGGIRCEKSTAYMKQIGFKKVYHLKGGVLKYLEDTNNRNQNWLGTCFVFDDRLALNPDLTPTQDACNV